MVDKYAAMVRLWRNAWSEFVPLLDYDTEIREVVCSTNSIESPNARYRRAARARGRSQRAGRLNPPALKCLYLVTRSLDPTGAGQLGPPSIGEGFPNPVPHSAGDVLEARDRRLRHHIR
jgi:hypothetical protein